MPPFILLALVAPGLSAPDAHPGNAEVRRATPAVIDFSPLSAAPAPPGRWTLKITVRSVSGKVLDRTVVGVKEPGPAEEMVIFLKTSLPAGWEAADLPGGKLVLRSYRGSPVSTAAVTLEGLPRKHCPTVRHRASGPGR